MKYIVSVSKKGKNIWKIYGYDYDDDDNLVFHSEKINPLLVWFYKTKKWNRIKNHCEDCNSVYMSLINWHDKDQDCPVCYEN